MKLAVLSDDPDEVAALFGFIYAAEAPFDVVAVSRDRSVAPSVLVELTLEWSPERVVALKRAGSDWYRQMLTRLAQIEELAARPDRSKEGES